MQVTVTTTGNAEALDHRVVCSQAPVQTHPQTLQHTLNRQNVQTAVVGFEQQVALAHLPFIILFISWISYSAINGGQKKNKVT